mmetsp:Transcript_6302/g.18078  ORF Transcript_6302/g.18078 Transcript_6302/m.18078 type:complete len:287 (+) Transcript_6302:52-912(+)
MTRTTTAGSAAERAASTNIPSARLQTWHPRCMMHPFRAWVARILLHLSSLFAALSDAVSGKQKPEKIVSANGGVSHGANASLPSASSTAGLIRQRRSIFPKDYLKGAVVGDEEVASLLEAANWAPTHGKTEPWRFTVLASHAARMEFYDLVQQTMDAVLEGPDLEMRTAKLKGLIAKKEPVLSHIIVITCRRAPSPQGKMMPEWEDQAAVACAVQNLHLQATAMGIAGYWSSFPAPDVRESSSFKQALGYDQRDICMGVFFLGRSDAAGSYRAKRSPLTEKVIWKH